MKVTEMYFHDHRQECNFDSLEGVFTHIIDNFEIQGEEAIPFAIKLGDNSVVNFNLCLFNYAFAKGRIDEEVLVNMLKNTFMQKASSKSKPSYAANQLNQEEIDGMIIKTYQPHEQE